MLLKQRAGDAKKYINELCKQGLDTECCVFCKVIKECASPDVPFGEAFAECFLKSKANIGGWKGLRDDLLFLLEEEPCDVNLCALPAVYNILIFKFCAPIVVRHSQHCFI